MVGTLQRACHAASTCASSNLVQNICKETEMDSVTHFHGVQAALQIANAASTNAYDDQYPSPYTVEAVRQGMDLPWWQKLLGARFKDGKFQLARLQVCTASSHYACVACLVLVDEAHLCSRSSAWTVPIGDQSAAYKACGASTMQSAVHSCNRTLSTKKVQHLPRMLGRLLGQCCDVHLGIASPWHDKMSWLKLDLACSGLF